MKKIIILLIALLLLSGCVFNDAPDIEAENIQPADAHPAVTVTDVKDPQTGTETEIEIESGLSLDDKMALIDFEKVYGYYTRKALEDETEYVELFSFDKNTFVRIATSDLEREVFAYNYASDDFTYMYYFDGQMTAKTIINVGTGALLEDDQGYAELLTENAEELKIYFSDLLEAAGLVPDELH